MLNTTISPADRLRVIELLTQSAKRGRQQGDILDQVFQVLGAQPGERQVDAIASLRPDGQDADRLLLMLGIQVVP